MGDQTENSTVGAVDPTTGSAVQVPTGLAEAFWRSQQVGFAPGAKVPVRWTDEEGKEHFGTVPSEGLGGALDDGATIASDADFKHAENQAKYGGISGALGAFAAGAADEYPSAVMALNPVTGPLHAVQYGLDVLQGHDRPYLSGPYVDPAMKAGVEDTHGIANVAGKLAGVGATMAVTPELGLPEKAGAKLAEFGARGVVQRGIATATQEGIRQIPFAAIDAVNKGIGEFNLSDDPELAAEKAFATMGADILGGVIGGAALGTAGGMWNKLAGKGARSVEEGASKVIANAAEVSAEGPLTRELAEVTAGSPSLTERAYTKTATKIPGLDNEQKAFVEAYGAGNSSAHAKRMRALISDKEKSLDTIGNEIGRGVDDVIQGNAKLTPSLVGEFKLDKIEKLMPKTEVGKFDAHEKLTEMVTSAKKSIWDTIVAADEATPGSGAVQLLEPFKRRADQLLQQAEAATALGEYGKAYKYFDDFKRLGDNVIAHTIIPKSGFTFDQFGNIVATRGAGASNDFIQAAMGNAYRPMREMADSIRGALESAAFGAMGEAQAKVNRGFADLIPRKAQLLQNLGKKTLVSEQAGGAGQVGFMGAADKSDSSKIVSWVRNIGRETNRTATEEITGAMNAIDRFHDAVKTSGYELSAADDAALAQMKRGVDSFRKTYATREKDIKDIAEFERLAEDGARRRMGGVLGVLNPVLDPASAMRNLARVEAAAAKTENSISKAVLGFFQGKPGAATKTAVSVENAPKAMAEVAKAAALPVNEMSSRVSAQHAGSEHVGEKFRMAMTLSAMKGIYFLSSKLPEQPPVDALDFAQSHGWKASPSEIQKWTAYANAVHSPLSVVEDFRNGVITSQGAEVLQKVYPRLYDVVRTRVVEEIVKNPRPFTRGDRVSLSILLGTPVDATMTPAAIRATMATFAAPPKEPPAPRRSAGQGMAAAMGLDTKTTQLALGEGTQ